MLGRLFHAWRRDELKSRPVQPPQAALDPAPELAPAIDDVGLLDMIRSGWFNSDSGELYTGFPIGPDDVVVDLGCGDGSKTGFCAGQGAHIILADLDPNMVAVAWRRLASLGATRLTPVVSNGVPFPLADGAATRIIASEVLEHVEDPAQFIAELVRIGRPGALYLFTVPDPVAEDIRKTLAPPAYFERPNHIRIIGRDAFGQMVTDAGLVIERRGSNGFHTALWWMFIFVAEREPFSPDNLLRKQWDDTWRTLLSTPDGMRIKAALDAFMPMSQCIVARKP